MPVAESEEASRRAAFRHFFFLGLLFPLYTNVNKALVLLNTCLGLQQRSSQKIFFYLEYKFNGEIFIFFYFFNPVTSLSTKC